MNNKGNREVVRIDSLSSVTVPSGAMEKLICVSARRVRQLADEGILVRAAHGKYLLVDSISNYIKHLKINSDICSRHDGDGLSYDTERAKNERIKRKQNELKYGLMKGQLYEAEQISRIWSDMLISFKTRLFNIPPKLAPLLTDKNDAGYIQSILTDEINEALAELKDFDPIVYQSADYIKFETEDTEAGEDKDDCDE